MQQWDYENNDNITPDNVTAGSTYSATWRCSNCCEHCGQPHVWRALVSRRANGGDDCPYCSCGHRVCRCQSLAAQRPGFMEQWDESSNPGLDLEVLGCNSSAEATWRCPEHGPWVTRISTRNAGSGCPECAHSAKRGISTPKRGLMKDECPAVFAQLHPTLNGDLSFAQTITCGSNRVLWWLCTEEAHRPAGCPHEHAWQAYAMRRCDKRTPNGCPFCTERQVCPCNSIACKHPSLLRFWHHSRNEGISPDTVPIFSKTKRWWQHVDPASDEVHEWQATVSSVVRRYIEYGMTRMPCPICHGRQPYARRREAKTG